MRTVGLLLAAATVTATLPWSASAAEPDVSNSGKGIVAGTLLGAELTTGAEAALGVRPTWAYLVGGLSGGAAGGVGGYFLERAISEKPTMLLLTGSMLLVIPTTVFVLKVTGDNAPERAPNDGSVPLAASRPATGAALAVAPDRISVAVPVPEVRDVFDLETRAVLGVAQATEWRFPLVDYTF